MVASPAMLVTLEPGVDDLRVTLVRRGDVIRLLTVISFAALHAFFGYWLEQVDWRGNLTMWVVYLALATAALLIDRRWDLVARRGGFAIPLLDMPMLFLLQASLAPTTNDPTGIVGFTAGAYVGMVMWSGLSLHLGLIAFSTAMAAVLQSLLFVAAGSDVGGVVATVILMAVAGALTSFAAVRLVRMVQRVAEEQVRARTAAALAAERERFVATVSHDFRSPLAIILSCLQTVAADPTLAPADSAAFLERATRQVRRLSRMATDLLELARLGGGELATASVAVNDLAHTVIATAQPLYTEQGLTLRLDLPDALPPVTASASLLERALGNLLDNARRFTPAGGTVTLAADLREREIALEVRDTGCGIPPEEQAHLFEPFFQGAAGAARSDGSGLGLSIVAEIATRHGGRVEVASAPGQGSTFRLLLPRASSTP